ncbi:MAG: nuclear transport factor 2 family protein [Planctomycetes bacterium]|nr:nuclear transport factor 2 family protein [Planctomycetota bacterium]
MRPLELAQQYMDIFFSGKDWDALGKLLSDDFTIHGPLSEFDSPKTYIDSLKTDPPKEIDYKMIRFYEDESSACLVYRFLKSGVSTTMTQVFEVKKDKINKILLVFDTNDIAD